MGIITYSFQNPTNACYQKGACGCKGKTYFIYPKLAPFSLSNDKMLEMIYFFVTTSTS